MAGVGLRSFDALARRAIAHRAWPAEVRAQPRSLAAVFGRLDRGLDTEWLADRPLVQQILSDLLGCSIEDVRATLHSTASARNPLLTTLFVTELPRARAVDLLTERLPPSIPIRLSLPATWERLRWCTSYGAGRTFVGRWLQARGLAEVACVTRPEDWERFQSAGPPLYVELMGPLDLFSVEGLPSSRSLCIAEAQPSQSQCGIGHLDPEQLGFEELANSPMGDSLDLLVDWVMARLPAASRAEPRAWAEWLRVGPMNWAAAETLADVLGWCGLVSEIGLKRTSRAEPKLLLDWAVRQQLATLTDDRRTTVLPRGEIPNLLVQMAQVALFEDSRLWLAPRPLEDWAKLVPDEYRQPADMDWLRSQLAAAGIGIHARDIERAAARIPPSAHRLLVGLREAGLLQPVGQAGFVLRPHFLARLVESLAKEAMVHSLPATWGEALLRPETRATVLSAVHKRARISPEGLIEDVLELVEEDSPALVGSVESCFVSAGLASLAGTELPTELVQELFQEQMKLVVSLPGMGCQPRIVPASPSGPFDTIGAFYLAAFALSEPLSSGSVSRRHPELIPWHQPEPHADLSKILDAIADTLRDGIAARAPWCEGSLGMMDRLRESVGVVIAANGRPHPLLQPAVVLDELQLGVLQWTSIELLRDPPWQLDLLLAMARQRAMTSDRLVTALWQAWLASGRGRDQPPPQEFPQISWWQHAPAEPVAHWLIEPDQVPEDLALQSLPEQVWYSWAALRRIREPIGEPARLWACVPDGIGVLLVTAGTRMNEAARQVAWRRWPAGVIERIEQERTSLPDSASHWLKCAPISSDEAIAEAAIALGWARSGEPFLANLRQRLHATVGRGQAAWRRAYAGLVEIERQLARASGIGTA